MGDRGQPFVRVVGDGADLDGAAIAFVDGQPWPPKPEHRPETRPPPRPDTTSETHALNNVTAPFGCRHARGRFEREDLQANLTGAEWTDDEAFAAYGLDDATIAALHTWAVEWADGLATRLLEESTDPDID
jgi:hypothetical protein